MKRRELAIAAGLSYPYVSEIENGQKEPSAKALRQLADALELSTPELATLTDRVSSAEDSSSVLLEADAPRSPSSSNTAASAGGRAGAEGDVSTGNSVRLDGSPGDTLERWVTDLVRRVVHEELAIWTATVLPQVVRAHLEATDEGRER